MKTKVKAIDINAKEWFDKTYGNSYFSAEITINYGMDSEQSIIIPFTYGYGDQYIFDSTRKLKELENITTD